MIDAVIREIGIELGYRGLTLESASATQIGAAYWTVCKRNPLFTLTHEGLLALSRRLNDLYWNVDPTDYWEKWFI